MCCRYGYETVAYYSGHTEEERIHADTNLSNPMCNVFPTEVGFSLSPTSQDQYQRKMQLKAVHATIIIFI